MKVEKDTHKTKEKTIEELAISMTEMYWKCECYQINDFLLKYSEKTEETSKYIQICIDTIVQLGNGTEQKQLLQMMLQLQKDKFVKLTTDRDEGFAIKDKMYKAIGSMEIDTQNMKDHYIRTYHDDMELTKEYLRYFLRKIEEIEAKYESFTSRMDREIDNLQTAFEKELTIAKENHNNNIKKGLAKREEELVEFETWSDAKKQQMFFQLAKLSEVHEVFYQIYHCYMEKINKQAKHIFELFSIWDVNQSQVQHSGPGGEEHRAKYDKFISDSLASTKAFILEREGDRNQEKSIFMQRYDGMGESQKKWTDVAGGLVEFFQGKEEKARYLYYKKYKVQIEYSLCCAVEDLYKKYKEEMQTQLERLWVYCKTTKDSLLAEELGTIEDIKRTKQKLQELLQENTDFIYREKNLMDLLLQDTVSLK